MPTLKHFQPGRCAGAAFNWDAMGSAGRSDELEPLLVEQLAYYRAIAAEYEDYAIPGPGRSELVAALDSFRPAGRVLELACGIGVWTELLLRHATRVTAVDASPEMLAIASARVRDERVRFMGARPSLRRRLLRLLALTRAARALRVFLVTRFRLPGNRWARVFCR